jgi:hypothetical protein
MAVIVSRQELVKRINALPENAEIIIVSNVRHITDGRPDDHASLDVVGVHPSILNERVSWLLQTVLTFLFSGVYHRG